MSSDVKAANQIIFPIIITSIENIFNGCAGFFSTAVFSQVVGCDQPKIRRLLWIGMEIIPLFV